MHFPLFKKKKGLMVGHRLCLFLVLLLCTAELEIFIISNEVIKMVQLTVIIHWNLLCIIGLRAVQTYDMKETLLYFMDL